MEQDNSSDIDKLLEIAESSGKSNQQEIPSDVNKYIKYFNIKAGDTKVPAKVIYYHYRQWRKRRYISRRWFFANFSKIYERTIWRNDSAYMLDPEPFDLTIEGRTKANTFLRKERSGKKKKKAKSKS